MLDAAPGPVRRGGWEEEAAGGVECCDRAGKDVGETDFDMSGCCAL